MNIIKNDIDNYGFNIELVDDKNDIIQIEYAGADLYWIMPNYYEGNLFIITKEDVLLFSQMNEVFKQIEKYDNRNNKVFNNNCFEWISEAYGLPEDSNKLIITKKLDSYEIHFFNNPNRYFGNNNICCICFCLSGSRNPEIAYAFSSMFLEYTNFENKRPNILKKQNNSH